MEKFSHPTVAVIIENPARTEILMQERAKPEDPYSGSMELPGGRLTAFEHVEKALKREVREETGLELTEVEGRVTEPLKGPNQERVIAFQPFCGEQILDGEQPWAGFVFLGKASGTPRASPENKKPRWVSLEELQELIKKKKVFWYHAQALRTYLKQRRPE